MNPYFTGASSTFADELGHKLDDLSAGDKGQQVYVMQTLLNEALGYVGLNANGEFDYWTEKAVMQFQREQGLTVDGRVGQETWSAIITQIV